MLLERQYSSSLIISNSDQSNEKISQYSHDSSSLYDKSYIFNEQQKPLLSDSNQNTNSINASINNTNIMNLDNNKNSNKKYRSNSLRYESDISAGK